VRAYLREQYFVKMMSYRFLREVRKAIAPNAGVFAGNCKQKTGLRVQNLIFKFKTRFLSLKQGF
jgi:hypothetical protein